MVRKGRHGLTACREATNRYHEAVEFARQLHPESDAERLFYRSYGIALLCCPESYIPCHMCMQESLNGPHYVIANGFDAHQRKTHPRAKIRCEHCNVKFLCTGDAGKHQHYVHVLDSGWWNTPTAS